MKPVSHIPFANFSWFKTLSKNPTLVFTPLILTSLNALRDLFIQSLKLLDHDVTLTKRLS